MNSKLENNLKQIFSLLPDRQAEEAYHQLLADMDNDPFNLETNFEWADFSLSGEFLRGGISEVASQKTVVITNSQEDAEIAEIVRWAKVEGAQAGALHWAANTERIYWFLPLTHSRSDQFSENRIRGFSISNAVFSAVISLFNAGANLSQSEERVIYQLLAGVELRAAAETDGISYETKRAHIKSTCEKLFCNSQKDIVRKILGQMVHLLTLSDAEVIHTETVENFVAQYLPNDARFSIQRLKNGRLMRILECGPADGTPVIMVHGIMFPIILRGLAKHLEQEKIRLIMPVRSGFLENVPNSLLYTSQGLVTGMLEDIALFIEQNNLSPAVFVGQSLGAVIAVRFARLYPQLVSRLILLSLNFARKELTGESNPGNFYGALRNLKIEPALFNMVNSQLVKFYSQQDTCQEMLSSMFESSRSDTEVLEGKYSKISGSELFSQVAQDSMFGITADFSFSMESWRAEAQELTMPITFIHGLQDPLTKLDEADEIFSLNANCTALFIENGGHFISVSHANIVWPHIAQLATDIA